MPRGPAGGPRPLVDAPIKMTFEISPPARLTEPDRVNMQIDISEMLGNLFGVRSNVQVQPGRQVNERKVGDRIEPVVEVEEIFIDTARQSMSLSEMVGIEETIDDLASSYEGALERTDISCK